MLDIRLQVEKSEEYIRTPPPCPIYPTAPSALSSHRADGVKTPRLSCRNGRRVAREDVEMVRVKHPIPLWGGVGNAVVEGSRGRMDDNGEGKMPVVGRAWSVIVALRCWRLGSKKRGRQNAVGERPKGRSTSLRPPPVSSHDERLRRTKVHEPLRIYSNDTPNPLVRRPEQKKSFLVETMHVCRPNESLLVPEWELMRWSFSGQTFEQKSFISVVESNGSHFKADSVGKTRRLRREDEKEGDGMEIM
ncbi:hypothetical protein FB45DRAFT_863248 [Roridomyces roridus]|uniref:Uncharacterized protein n=1 Tax=Roridomyces roridus TaxID=1738132 RepID=A0AAD7C8Z7_9AGAR|nr:hypothetical protein FB45DRAFT_863248 [Roridomyces roridus]